MENGMNTSLIRRFGLIAGAVALAAGGIVAPAWGQRDPGYAAARSQGQVGEKMDGYLGIVGESTSALRKMVDDINIKRKAVYANKAKQQRATVEEYAFTSGCMLIKQTKPGEKYQSPSGWKTRTAQPPERDPRCP